MQFDSKRFARLYPKVMEGLAGQRVECDHAKLAKLREYDFEESDWHWNVNEPAALMEKLSLTLGQLGFQVPEIGKKPLAGFAAPFRSEPQIRLPEKNLIWQNIPRFLDDGIKSMKAIAQGAADSSFSPAVFFRTVMMMEHMLRALAGRSGVKGEMPLALQEGQALLVPQLSLSERCLASCSHCGIRAGPKDGQMEWGLFEALLSSPQIAFPPDILSSEQVYINNGEPLIYHDKKEGRVLADAVRRLVVERGCRVCITTTGLLPQNRELGEAFFHALREMGPYASDVRVDLSFNLFAHGWRNPNQYVECFERTLELLSGTACHFGETIVSYTKGNMDITERLIARLRDRYGLFTEERVVTWMGAARENFPRSICSTQEEGCSDMENFQGMWEAGYYIPRFTIRANGDVAPFCTSLGVRGSAIGNVYENDSRQIAGMVADYREALGKMKAARPIGMHMCEAHAQWGKRFSAPQSANPIVARR